MNAGFTGDLDRHERELRAVWGGPLCVTAYERSANNLGAVQADLLESAVPALGLEVLSSWVTGRRQVVGLEVVAATAQQLRVVEDRYGKGTVEVTAALTPER